MLLWVIFAGLTALVLLALLRPLASRKAGDKSRAAFDATVYRDQLSEVESDRERGLIGEADAEAARIEIARRLLATDAEERGAHRQQARTPTRAVAIGLAVILPPARPRSLSHLRLSASSRPTPRGTPARRGE